MKRPAVQVRSLSRCHAIATIRGASFPSIGYGDQRLALDVGGEAWNQAESEAGEDEADERAAVVDLAVDPRRQAVHGEGVDQAFVPSAPEGDERHLRELFERQRAIEQAEDVVSGNDQHIRVGQEACRLERPVAEPGAR